jgi:transposase
MEGRHKPLTTRRATRLVLKRPRQPRQRTDEDAQLMAHRQAQPCEVAVAIEWAHDVCAIVREGHAGRCDRGLTQAIASAVVPLRRIATGLRADYEAVEAGLIRPWSTGPVGGQINRLKMLKRSMCGRATLDLLSQRFLLTA